LGWDCATRGGNSAVAFPLQPGKLFTFKSTSSAASLSSASVSGNNNSIIGGQQMNPFTDTSAVVSTDASYHDNNISNGKMKTSKLIHNNNIKQTANTTTFNTSESKSSSMIMMMRSANSTIDTSNINMHFSSLSDEVLEHLSLPTTTTTTSSSSTSSSSVTTIVNGTTGIAVPWDKVEIEILTLIAKLPGMIMQRECKIKLDKLKRDHSALFAKRSLFVQVQKMLESYSFKLDMRRHVVSLFSEPAKLKGGGLVTWMGSC